MQPVMDVSDVREFEAALGEKGLKAQELMRRAGAVVALQAAKLVETGSVVVLCGMGNNGGDGWVAADNLARHGYEVSVVSAAAPAVMKSEAARRAAARAVEMGVPVHVDPSRDKLDELLSSADVVVDAVFGTGFKGVMPSPYVMWVKAVDESFAGSVVAVDIPSGISAETGMAEGPHFEADVTVTMFAVKPGLISGEGRAASGMVVVASLATDGEGLADLSDAAAAFMLEDADYADALIETNPLQDKYSRGRVLVVAGSSRYPGAAVMAALAAARAGAGYVTLAVPQPVVPVAQAHLLSIPVVGLPADADGAFSAEAADKVAPLAAKADCVLCGPGMTTSFGACEVVRRLLVEQCPLVLDADALNALVKVCTGSAVEHPEPLRRERPLVLTPHRGELGRLLGSDVVPVPSFAEAMHGAQKLAWAVGSSDFCVVAKGPLSSIAMVDGTVVPEPGPASLATAGTGDVLAGLLASLLAQEVASSGGETPASGALLMLMAAGTRVHGTAARLAEGEFGTRGVIAPDVAAKVGLARDEFAEAVREAADLRGEDAGSRLEGTLAFEDESRITPPPEVERLIRSDATYKRADSAPGEILSFGDDLEEPAQEARPVPAAQSAQPVRPAPASVPVRPAPSASAATTTVFPAVGVPEDEVSAPVEAELAADEALEGELFEDEPEAETEVEPETVPASAPTLSSAAVTSSFDAVSPAVTASFEPVAPAPAPEVPAAEAQAAEVPATAEAQAAVSPEPVAHPGGSVPPFLAGVAIASAPAEPDSGEESEEDLEEDPASAEEDADDLATEAEDESAEDAPAVAAFEEAEADVDDADDADWADDADDAADDEPEAPEEEASPEETPATEGVPAAPAGETRGAAKVTDQVPPFLARAVSKAGTAGAAGAGQAEGATTVMEPVRPAEPGEAPLGARRLTPEEIEDRRVEEFHERATMRIDDGSVTPVDKRPSAKPRRRR